MRVFDTYNDYEAALKDAGPKLKELILDRAAHDEDIGLEQLIELVHQAYPEGG